MAAEITLLLKPETVVLYSYENCYIIESKIKQQHQVSEFIIQVYDQ